MTTPEPLYIQIGNETREMTPEEIQEYETLNADLPSLSNPD
jgi:hypothetical protein